MPTKLTALPPQSEKSFAAQVDQLAVLMGWEISKTFLSIRSPAGFPDRVFCRPPRLVFAELKRLGGKTTPAQDKWLKLLRACNVEVYLWNPEAWPEIECVLR